jgi:hypothetical protein
MPSAWSGRRLAQRSLHRRVRGFVPPLAMTRADLAHVYTYLGD